MSKGYTILGLRNQPLPNFLAVGVDEPWSLMKVAAIAAVVGGSFVLGVRWSDSRSARSTTVLRGFLPALKGVSA